MELYAVNSCLSFNHTQIIKTEILHFLQCITSLLQKYLLFLFCSLKCVKFVFHHGRTFVFPLVVQKYVSNDSFNFFRYPEYIPICNTKLASLTWEGRICSATTLKREDYYFGLLLRMMHLAQQKIDEISKFFLVKVTESTFHLAA